MSGTSATPSAGPPPYPPKQEDLTKLDELEKKVEGLLEVEEKLRDRAEQALTHLGAQSQVLMMYIASSALFLQNSVDKYARFTGLFLSSLSIAAFIAGVWLSTHIARQKLRNLVAPVQLLNKRTNILHDSIEAFLSTFMEQKVYPSWLILTHPGAAIPPDTIGMETFFERRLRVVYEETNESDDFLKSYLNLVTWSTVAAATVAVGSFATSLYSCFAGGRGLRGGLYQY